MIVVVVNGQPEELAPGSSLAELVDQLGYERRGLAVAVGDEVVPRSTWAERTLDHGDRVEIITATQGG